MVPFGTLNSNKPIKMESIKRDGSYEGFKAAPIELMLTITLRFFYFPIPHNKLKVREKV